MKVVTIHGIRRQNRWNESLKSLDCVSENNIEIIPFDFGFFSFVKFLWPLTREKVVDSFCKFYSDKFTNTNDNVCAIAHSFGTYILYKSMLRHKHIKFKTIIFCGSILNTKTDFRPLIANNQFEKLLNDFGKKDWYLFITRYLINGYCGKAGKNGFVDIPEDKIHVIINRSNYFRHSDYFLKINMEKEWISEIIKTQIRSNYKTEILRNEVIKRIYLNIENSHFPFKILKAEYNARIDKSRNYFAKSSNYFFNDSKQAIFTYSFATSADSTNDADEMNIVIRSESDNKVLTYNVEKDRPNLKKIIVSLNSQLNPNQEIKINHYFTWEKTITFNGDTDHWTIQGIKNITIRLNFPYKLINPRVYAVSNYDIIAQHTPTLENELDNTHTYIFDYVNNLNVDGLIFYFEGHNVPAKKSVHTNKLPISRIKKKSAKLTSKIDVKIEKAAESDIVKIFDIEKLVEHRNAAEHSTLKARLHMFNDGFLVLRYKDKIVSYIESLIWNRKPFETFEDISNFPTQYNVRGKSLYIIFVATSPSYRKRGYASKLINEIEKIAIKYRVNEICLVAKDDLVSYYKKLGFVEEVELPHFLKNRNYKSMLMTKKLTTDK